VSHDSRVLPFADRVFHLEDGRLLDPDEGPDVLGLSGPALPRSTTR
jgi:hypothetical protein